MGETKKSTKSENSVKMISVDQANAQMQEVVKQANTQMQQMVVKVQQLDAMLRDRTVEHLFKVVEFADNFNTEFVVKCTNAIEHFLTQVALTEPANNEETANPTIEKE